MDKLCTDGRTVERVRVVVHTVGAWPNGTMSDNHWSIYLILANNGGSVRMNMKAELDDPKGTLEWSTNLAYTLTNSAIEHWDYMVNPGVTVANVYGLVMGKGRDRYSMSGGGSGCRFWEGICESYDLETVLEPLLDHGNGYFASRFGADVVMVRHNHKAGLMVNATHLFKIAKELRRSTQVKTRLTIKDGPMRYQGDYCSVPEAL